MSAQQYMIGGGLNILTGLTEWMSNNQIQRNRLMPQQVIISMKEHYPFGELEGNSTDILNTRVRRTLTFQGQAQQDSIKETIHFLTAINSPSLVSLHQYLLSSNQVHLYYQYCPLKLEKWILSISEDIIQQLQEQMLALLEELTDACIKFQFDPQCLGISQEMKVKYFLNNFTVELDSLEQYHQLNKQKIHSFFRQLFKEKEEESPQKSSLLDSISTVASFGTDFLALSQSFSQLATSQPTQQISCSKKILLEGKVESSLKKSMEVLQRFKRMSKNESQ